MSFTFSLRLLVPLIGLLAAPDARAQVIQIEDDGQVNVHAGPTIVTGDGAEAIPLESGPTRFAGTRFAPTSYVSTAARIATTLQPVGMLGDIFAGAAREVGVDARLLHAVGWQESRFRQERVSVKGAIGIMQLMPDTARALGVDPRDPVQNVRGGAHLLARLLRQYGGNIDLTLAAYNAGPGAVQRYGGVPPYAETRDYIARIKQFLHL